MKLFLVVACVSICTGFVTTESCHGDEDCHGTSTEIHCQGLLSWRAVCRNGQCSCQSTSHVHVCRADSDCLTFSCPLSPLRPKCVVGQGGHKTCHCG